MQQPDLNWIANFTWGIADDVLRDLYVRGKYRDVILPMTVLRRLDAVLEPKKQAVLETKKWLDSAGITNQDGPLRDAAVQAFYNTSKFTLGDFWSWAYSDLLSNVNRSRFAEFLVASALGILDSPRIEWDAVDLRYRHKGIEVMSAA